MREAPPVPGPATNTSASSVRALPFQRARASASVLLVSVTGLVYERYTNLFSAKRGWSTTSISPFNPPDRTVGTPPTGVGIEDAVSDDPQLAAAFGDQQAAVRQKRQAPRVGQALRDDDHADVLSFGGVVHDGLVRERRDDDALRRDRRVVSERNGLLRHTARAEER